MTQTQAAAEAKTDDLIAYSDGLKQALLAYSFNGADKLQTARNVFFFSQNTAHLNSLSAYPMQ